MKRIFLLIFLAATAFAGEPLIPMPPPGPPPDSLLNPLGDKSVVVSANEAMQQAMKVFKWSGPDSSWNFPEDARYVKPTVNEFKDFLKFFNLTRAKEKYESQSWDCDDTAREALHLGRLWGHRNYKGLQVALMIGAAYVEVRTKGSKKVEYHVCNFVGLSDGTWFFFEAQKAQVVSVQDGLKEYRILKLQF